MTSSRTLAQQRALAVVPKVTGGLSVIFSALIVATILRDNERRKLTYHRLLLGISIVDMSASLWMFLSTWPIPVDSDILWAAGTEATCTAQGFFLQFGVSAPFYSASLSIYYYLVIVRGWKEAQIHKVEWLLHAFPLGWATISAVTGLALQVYESAGLWCWVGAQYRVFRWTAYYGALWTMIFVATAACIAIYLHVRQYAIIESVRGVLASSSAISTNNNVDGRQSRSGPLTHSQQRLEAISMDFSNDLSTIHKEDEDDDDEEEEMEIDQFRRSGTAPRTNQQLTHSDRRRMVVPAAFAEQLQRNRALHRQATRMREIAHQCFFYASAFYINFAALSTIRFIQLINPDQEIWYPLLLTAAFTVPMQGLSNVLIYLRPKIRSWLVRHCCCARSHDTTPWWYRLAQSLSDRHHENNTDGVPPERRPRRHRDVVSSAAAVVHINPGVLNEESPKLDATTTAAPEVDVNKTSQKKDPVVLVVVDTPDHGRQWRIEETSNPPNKTKKDRQTTASTTPLPDVCEEGDGDDDNEDDKQAL